MNSWARRRKLVIFLIVFASLIVLVGLPTYFFLYKSPTCFDSKQNGDETGVDCGGSCQLICTTESIPLIVKGDPQILLVAKDTYEVALLVENPNPTGEVFRARYTIKLFDATSTIPIKTIEGQAYIPKSMTIAVFEGPFNLSNTIPTRASFEWKESSIIWKQSSTPLREVTVRDKVLSRASSTPRLDATVVNTSLENVSNIDLTALIFDQSGNIFAASKTFVDTLPAGESLPIVFTWPSPFTEKIIDTEVIVRILPDRSFVR